MKKIIITAVLATFIFVSGYPVAYAEDNEEQKIALLAQIETLLKLVLALQEKLSLQNSAQTTDSVFTNIISSGSENDSVALLQQVLASDPEIYPEAMVTGYFGPLTTAALQKFQKSWGLDATGTFTNQTRYVLASVLTKVPLSEENTDYLQKTEVRDLIKQATTDYNLRSLVVNGKVVFSTQPSFEFDQRNSDIATLQRILATDPDLYPEQQISTEYNIATAQAVSRLQLKYGLTPTARVDTPTLILLKEILVLNNSSVIVADLLKKKVLLPKANLATQDPGVNSIIVPGSSSGASTTVVKREPPYAAVITVDKNRNLAAYLAFRNGKVDVTVPVDLNMEYKVKFKNSEMTLREASSVIVAEAIAGMPVDEEVAAYVRKEAVFFYDATPDELARIPISYEVDPTLLWDANVRDGR